MGSPYEHLRSDTAIRLVVIHAGEQEDPVSCATLQLDDQEQASCHYRALSYVWGPANNEYSIKLDGVDFKVRRNLFYALQHLRKLEEDLRLWTDAISIDQNSRDEKAKQILRMKTIFSGAQEVILWLGEGDSTSGRGMCLLDEIFVDHGQENVSWCPGDSLELAFCSEMLVHALGHERSYEALSSIFSRDFWSRTWIVQEVVLATELVVHCGRHSVSWKAFEMYDKCLEQIGEWIDQGRYGQGPLVLLQELDQEFNANKCIGRWIDRYHTLARGIIEHRRERLVGEKDLPALLDRDQFADVTKIRDKIYGMFGMWESPYKSLLTVDYEHDILQLYANVMRVCENTATDVEDFSALLQESLKLITPQIATLIRDRLPDPGHNIQRSVHCHSYACCKAVESSVRHTLHENLDSGVRVQHPDTHCGSVQGLFSQ